MRAVANQNEWGSEEKKDNKKMKKDNKASKNAVKTLTRQEAIKAIETVEDPELGIDIWTLGLIYDIRIEKNNNIHILMTLTSPTCPYAPMLVAEMKGALVDAGFNEPGVEFTFDPPWEPSDDVKMMLGLA